MACCQACNLALLLRADDNEEDDNQSENKIYAVEVPDDLELGCGCHFHWQCLLDESSTMATSLRCPSCEAYLPINRPGPSTINTFVPSSSTVILAQYTSEGGVEPDVDLLPTITEEAYLANHPEARRPRAFQVMCSEGDTSGIIELLDETESAGIDVVSMLRYQDPLAGMQSGLHFAIERDQVEVAFLLLWLCSRIPSDAFPEIVRGTAETMGVGRISAGMAEDIRYLEDSNGMTAMHRARQGQEGVWIDFLATASYMGA